MKAPLFLRKLGSAFDIPRSEPNPPKAKSPLRLQFETELSDSVNSASRALNLGVLGALSGVQLLANLLCSIAGRWHAALAKHVEHVEWERTNRKQIDQTNAHFATDTLIQRKGIGWEKGRRWEAEA